MLTQADMMFSVYEWSAEFRLTSRSLFVSGTRSQRFSFPLHDSPIVKIDGVLLQGSAFVPEPVEWMCTLLKPVYSPTFYLSLF
jgi:hypothetical protein